MHIAYCSNNEAFKKDRLRDKSWSYLFPGSGWITCLYDLADKLGIDVVSGDIAIENVLSKKWNPKDVHVIQEMQSGDGCKLIELGAVQFLIICFEAPLYAPFFYDKVDDISRGFKYGLGFGLSKNWYLRSDSQQGLQFRFPSFYLDDMQQICPWSERKKLVLVAANKYRVKNIFIPSQPSIINLLRQLKSVTWQLISPSYRKSLTESLHDQRLEAIEYFCSLSELDLYGAGWDFLGMLPLRWNNRLKGFFHNQYLGRCQNKLETIRGYQVSICFENMVMPGYMTEKIIDCFVAGTIPLYLGAPDIDKLVPVESFIDMRKFASFDQFERYMNSISEHDAINMIEAGREYLKTKIGKMHSYEGFAESVITLAKTC